MESLSPQVVSAAKLPILNPNEFDLWKMRIEQYFLMTDYSLWEVILNGDSPAPTRVVEDKHHLKFNSHKDAKTLMEAIEKRFRGNTETKKVQKTLLKQQYENITGSSSESLDQIHDRLLPSEWKTHTLIWRNKTDLDEQSLDDLFNSLKIYEAEVKSSSSAGTQNIAFVSSSNTDSTIEPVSAAASVFAVCAKMPVYYVLNVDSLRSYDWSFQAEEEPANYALMDFSSLSSSFDNELRDNALVTLRQKLEKAEQERDDLKLKLEKFQTSSKNLTELLASQTNDKTGLGYNSQVFTHAMFDCDDYLSLESDESWPPSFLYDRFQSSDGYHVVPLPYTRTFMPPKPNLVFTNAPNGVETDHSAFQVKLSPTEPDQDLSHLIRPSAPIIEDWVSDFKDESETKPPQTVPSFVESTEQVKSPRHFVQHVETSIPATTPKPASPKPTSNGKRKNRKACFVCKSLDHLIKDCDYHKKKMAQPTARNHAHRGNHKQYAPMTHQISQKHMVSAAVLTQSRPVPITVVRLVSTVVPKTSVTRPKQVKPIVTKPNSPKRMHITRSPSPKASNSPPRVTIVKAPVVNAAQGNPKGGKISGKGKIQTGKLDFDDVYFVKELKFNLFSVSQMCDKKNSILLTDTECLVLSPGFKLLDESQVLLRVSRENNMYNVNLKNIVPSGALTCLFAKATIDESNLWHRRLCYINFKTINKLVKGNHVRGLPTKVFKNDNTCVACKKGKQHRASCKTKPVSSVDQPLYRLHMDLFGPTFVKSMNKKSYCLVVIDDYSRVLVPKHHNKIPYELLHGRTPSIGFMRPFGCPVTILNTLDSLGKFDEKVDEGFLVRYSVSSKAFRVFNNRTRIVQETLHVNFLENKPNVLGSGPTWLFYIDSLTKTINYQPVTAGNQSNPSAGFQDKFDAEKAGEESDQQYVHFPVWKQDDKTKTEAKGKSPVESYTGYRNLSLDFEDFSDNSINEVNVADTLVPTVGQISPNNTNTFSAAELENITYSDDEDDVGAKADFNNLETSITISPIPTTRVQKDHPVTQIIGDLSSATQTRSMTRVAKDQGGLSQMFNDDFHTCMFACFLSQEEPKRVHQALKDSSWIEAMHEELLQFKMQKVWILVNLPHGKRAIDLLPKAFDVKRFQYLVARVNTPRCDEDMLELMELTVFLLPKVEKLELDERFNLIIDFLSGSSIKYALTVNPNIYVSCIKQFWTTVAVKKVNDVIRLQALVDKKKVVVTEATIMEALRLDDAEGVECLPNEEIFAELAIMGYEKPSTKLTFYKAFKPVEVAEEGDAKVHGEEVNDGDAAEGDVSAVNDEVPTVAKEPSIPSPTPPTPPPQPSHDIPYTSQVQPTTTTTRCWNPYEPSPRRMMIAEMDQDDDVVLEEAKEVPEDAMADKSVDIQGRQAESQAEIYKIDLEHANKVLSMQEDESEPYEVQEVVEVVTTAKIITEVITAASETITSASTTITAAEAQVPAVTLIAAPSRVTAAPKDPAVKKYQALKRKPQTEAQARKNMMLYLKNVASFKMDYFKGMSYDDIRPIFEAKFNTNVAFLQKTKEQIEEEDSRALKRLNETLTEKAAKRKKLDEEAEELKRHLQIVPNEYDDSLIKERFSTIKPKNFFDDFLLVTLGAMFEKPDIHAQVWKNQRSVHGPAKVKGWKLLESCGVQIITFTTTQLILLVERKYPLTRFTLDQMLNAVRLEVEEESEVSLGLLRGIFINQSKYALEMLKKYSLNQCDAVDIPMVGQSKLDEDPNRTPLDPNHYLGMVRSFMYLTASRPDLVFVVCMCARYQAKPTDKHLTASAIALSCNTMQHSKMNIAFRYHFIKEQVENEVVELYFVKTDYQLADIFAKALARERFEFMIKRLGMQSITSKELKHLAKSDEE
nr:putative ribonuclease H-like domain-containing protein [Tanacetum cinerariifolium]